MPKQVHIHYHGHSFRTADGGSSSLLGELESRPVYASMPLAQVSHAALSEWARKRGVIRGEHRMHVTTAYTKEAVPVPRSYRTRDNAAGLVIPPGNRKVQRFGNQLVLCVDCPGLHDRWMDWRSRGATWDYPDYTPHITFADLKHNGGAVIDVAGEPFDEPITLLPEEVSTPRSDY